jgi:bifunctional DNA primase/polymerase-like protein
MSDQLAAASEYALRGLAVFPLAPRSKRPATQHGFHDATTDPDAVRAWFEGQSSLGVAVATGATAGVFVVDVDPPCGFQSLADLELRHETLPKTAAVVTGRGGLHLWFRHPGGVKIPSRNGALGVGLDVKGDGGYIVVPPTLHETGRRYTWLHGLDELADPPAWLLTLVVEAPPAPRPPRSCAQVTRRSRWAAAALAGERARVARACEGTRNDVTFRAACAIGSIVGGGGLDEREAEAVLVDAALDAGLPEREAVAVVRRGLRLGMQSPRTGGAS